MPGRRARGWTSSAVTPSIPWPWQSINQTTCWCCPPRVSRAVFYGLKPGGPDGVLTRIEAEPAGRHPHAAVVLPADWWVNGEFKDQYDPASDHLATISELFATDVGTAPAQVYASPDGSIVLPAYRV